MEAVRVGTFGTLPPDEALKPGNKVVSITCRIAPGLAAEVAVFVCALHLPSGPLEVRERSSPSSNEHGIQARGINRANSRERVLITFPFAPRFLPASSPLAISERGHSRLWS